MTSIAQLLPTFYAGKTWTVAIVTVRSSYGLSGTTTSRYRPHPQPGICRGLCCKATSIAPDKGNDASGRSRERCYCYNHRLHYYCSSPPVLDVTRSQLISCHSGRRCSWTNVTIQLIACNTPPRRCRVSATRCSKLAYTGRL